MKLNKKISTYEIKAVGCIYFISYYMLTVDGKTCIIYSNKKFNVQRVTSDRQ